MLTKLIWALRMKMAECLFLLAAFVLQTYPGQGGANCSKGRAENVTSMETEVVIMPSKKDT